MIRVYTDMVADMFHVGHLNLIKRAKKMGDYLIVGIHSDDIIAGYKRRPIIKEEDRYEIVRSCRYVDEVIVGAPLEMSHEFIKQHEIDLVVRGDDINEELLKQQAYPIKMGIMKYVNRTEGISTTEIISKIQQRGEFDWKDIWQRKALEKPYNLKAINGWEKVNISPSLVVQTIKKRLNLTSADHLLELGAGSGFLTDYFLRETKNYIGSDKSKNMVNLAKSIFDCEFINCEASSLPFDDKQFDYVIAYSIFQYFPSHRYAQKAISEMNRISKKGIYIGDLPIHSHDNNHTLYRREEFDGWSTSEGIYADERFDAWKIKNEY